jgi:formamidopyrimidine-DNA glycosylase
MTGRLIVRAAESAQAPLPYTNVLLKFTDGANLSFADVRTFGRMRLVEQEEPWAADFGLEPLSPDFTNERFSRLLAGRTTPIKIFLLDQRRTLAAGKLTRTAQIRLHESITSVLRRAIEMRGTSVDDYVDADGLRGGFQNVLSVYGLHGKACKRCGNEIIRTVLAQRGTWWCRTCQKH